MRAWNELLTEASLEWAPSEEGESAPLEYMGVDGHSPRRSGAKLLIRIGFGRGTVAFVGRWGSDAILVYIEEVTIIGAALAIASEAEPEQPEPPEAVTRAERPKSQERERIEELLRQRERRPSVERRLDGMPPRRPPVPRRAAQRQAARESAHLLRQRPSVRCRRRSPRALWRLAIASDLL